MSFSAELTKWLKKKVGHYNRLCDEPADESVCLERYWCGCTETGFYSEWEINWEELERQMDEFIKEFQKQKA